MIDFPSKTNNAMTSLRSWRGRGGGQPKILYPEKIFYKNEDKIKDGFGQTNRLALPEMLNKFFKLKQTLSNGKSVSHKEIKSDRTEKRLM